MENGEIINLDSSNAKHCLSRFVAPPNPTPVLRVLISDEIKHKMVVGLYIGMGCIFFIGIVAGSISYWIRGRRRTVTATKPMCDGDEYTADDMDCLSYAYRSHLYFSFLNCTSSNPSLKNCRQCEREADHEQLLRIAQHMSDRAKQFGRSPKVEELIAKGRRLKEWDHKPAYVAPGMVGEDDVGGLEEGEAGHTCRRKLTVRMGKDGKMEVVKRKVVKRKLANGSSVSANTDAPGGGFDGGGGA